MNEHTPLGRPARRAVLLAALLGLTLAIPLGAVGAPAAAGDETEKQAAMEKIRGHLDATEWKAAGKLLKIYKRRHAETPEEEAAVEALYRKAKGFEAFEKIQREYRRAQRARKGVKSLAKLLDSFADVPDLVEQAEPYMNGLRSTYMLILDDFEAWPTDDELEKMSDEEKEELPPRTRGVTLETDLDSVKQGRQAGRFTSKGGGGSLTLAVPENDWSEYYFFCFWLYNPKVVPKRMQHLRLHISSSMGGYFTSYIALDWEGWKDVRLLMHGKKSLFARHRRPDWKYISSGWLAHQDGAPLPIDLVFDDIRLEKAVK